MESYITVLFDLVIPISNALNHLVSEILALKLFRSLMILKFGGTEEESDIVLYIMFSVSHFCGQHAPPLFLNEIFISSLSKMAYSAA